MPTFNSQAYLVEAIESIRCQSYSEFELQIVDAGSTDLTAEICQSFVQKDSRLSFQVREGATPVTRFNEVLTLCQSEFLFIAHSDDIQHSRRIETQVAYFEDDEKLVMCGTNTFYWMHDFANKWGEMYSGIAEYPKTHEEIKAQLIFWWCFANPSLSFRVSHFYKHKLILPPHLRFVGDWLFYWNVAKTGKVGNTNQVLTAYRHHSESEGPKNRHELESEVLSVRKNILENSGLSAYLGDKQQDIFLNLKIERNLVTQCPDDYWDYVNLFDQIKKFSEETGALGTTDISKFTDLYLRQIKATKKTYVAETKRAAKRLLSLILGR